MFRGLIEGQKVDARGIGQPVLHRQRGSGGQVRQQVSISTIYRERGRENRYISAYFELQGNLDVVTGQVQGSLGVSRFWWGTLIFCFLFFNLFFFSLTSTSLLNMVSPDSLLRVLKGGLERNFSRVSVGQLQGNRDVRCSSRVGDLWYRVALGQLTWVQGSGRVT